MAEQNALASIGNKSAATFLLLIKSSLDFSST
jgi:hypothetical protein